MESAQGKVWMVDEVTGLSKLLFKVDPCSGNKITDMLAHQPTASLIIAISEKLEPEILQIFPLTNEVILRVSGTKVVNDGSRPPSSSIKNKKRRKQKKGQIFISFLHNQ